MKPPQIILILFLMTFPRITKCQTITRVESVQSLYVEVFRDSFRLGSATAFVIKSKTQNYLITNWHVVTNKNPNTKTWLDPKVPISPNRIVIIQNAKKLGDYTVRSEKLVDSKGVNLFKEYSIAKEMLDVVAIPMKDTLGDITIYPVNFSNGVDSVVLQPTDRLFVLGFPKGVKSSPVLPIWKSGLIASEPDIDQENKPIIWLDIASFPGMSGAPVYLITDKLTYRNGNSVNILGTMPSYFLGVFSHGKDINVGALWKGTYLKRIFTALE